MSSARHLIVDDDGIVTAVIIGSVDGSILTPSDDVCIGWIRQPDESFTPPPQPVAVPQSITRLQFVRQCKALGIWSQVQVYIAAADDVKDWWDYASAIERQSSVLIAAATAFSMTSQNIDEFFVAAAQLT